MFRAGGIAFNLKKKPTNDQNLSIRIMCRCERLSLSEILNEGQRKPCTECKI